MAKTAIGLQETVEELNAWWKGEGPNREKIGLTDKTEAYKTLTTMAATRSKQLKEKSNV